MNFEQWGTGNWLILGEVQGITRHMATLSNCGRFLWLHSEPCSLCPVGLGRKWYYLLQPLKKTQPNQGAMEWNAIIKSVTLPIDAPYSISIICWSTISLPHASANGAAGKSFCQLYRLILPFRIIPQKVNFITHQSPQVQSLKLPCHKIVSGPININGNDMKNRLQWLGQRKNQLD